MIQGWKEKYKEILKEFNYDPRLDKLATILLDSFIHKSYPVTKLKKQIHGKTVFVIGAGPSLSNALPFFKKFRSVTKIVADGAITPLMEKHIPINIVCTDLDGNETYLKKLGRTNTVFVVHAHGDNILKLSLAKSFVNCLGTTQASEYKKIHNYGGFTDGDRAVFLADYFGAKKIILFGMDFGNKIGKYSFTKKEHRSTKLKKLRTGKRLVHWLANRSRSKIFTTSTPIKGVKKIQFEDLDNIIT